jgi:alkylated DNA nucleotide flippase Atl1
MSRKWGTGTVVIPAPLEVDALMRQVPKGKVVTVNRLRAALARRHGATIGCPITTGIFAWIAAHAAVEAQAQGRKRVTPWWRTLKAEGELNPKFPGGVEAQARLLRAEGHAILPGKGKKPPRVADLEGCLAM